MDIIKVNYPDAPEPRIVHPPEDYTTNLEVRVKGSTLYVYRAVIRRHAETMACIVVEMYQEGCRISE